MYYPLLRKGDVMKSFPLIVVLFILLIIVGTSFFGGY
ncbi:sporulation protein YjcZ [Bacillus subtilis]|nr:sporulation protein YjcZ [Bacillus subtilis]UQZ59099.1 sporulation protein YjcZ [Bacillus subtilis]